MSGIARTQTKARLWLVHRDTALSHEQVKVINRLLDGEQEGFTGGISAIQDQKVAKVSKATATRHLRDLLEKGCLVRLEGGGRNTRYHLAP